MGKQKSLGIIRTLPRRVTLTARGLEYISSPRRPTSARVPPKYASRIATSRIYFDEGNYAGAVDEVYKLFEQLLRDRISDSLGETLSSQWKRLQTVRTDYDRASLGVLLGAVRELRLISPDSLTYKLFDSFLSLRNPMKHAISSEVSEDRNTGYTNDQSSARSALQIAEVLLRYWF